MITMRISKLTIAVAVLALVVTPVAADWDEGDPHKMHYPQLPDVTGWDVAATYPFTMVGDDWECSRTGPVTEIHIWGSWFADQEIPIVRFHLEIWSDQPAVGGEHSRPLAPLWDRDFFEPDGWVQRPWGMGDQGWFNPMTGFFNRPDHQQIWQYNFAIDPADAFVQEQGTIYWLVVYADLGFDPDPDAPPNWGWKTSLNHFNDDSVWGEITAQPVWHELLEPPDYSESLDQAFVINGPDEQDLFDWGDAPDPTFPTLSINGGANHLISGLYLGNTVDDEPDGQPDPNALGDDNNGAVPDDEDGVTPLSPFLPGAMAQIDVVASGPGEFDAWIDFDGDGTWAHPGEHLWGGASVTVLAGSNPLTFMVPASAVPGQTFARCRISMNGGLLPTGYGGEGEVEDYELFIEEEQLLDWGDAPDAPYRTLAVNNGANHVITQLFMGATVDDELDGQPHPNALGDDNAGAVPDDEDGVTILSPIFPGASVNIDVVASAPGMLDAWIDFDNDGAWAHTAEHLWGGVSVSLTAGSNPLTFTVPGSAALGQTFARFRISTNGSLTPDGAAPDGEVEDYELFIEQEVSLDFGDAPDQPYPTLLVSNGARHVLDGVTFMGAQVDGEPDGQPNGNATGDDINLVFPGVPHPPGDEDGVIWLTPLIPGLSAQVDVFANSPGVLDAWIDFDANGTWAEPWDQIFVSMPLNPGPNILPFFVPPGLMPAGTFARFRFSQVGGLTPVGLAPEGEVEDYEVLIEDPVQDWGDAPDQPYPTLSVSGGANHTILETVYIGAGPPDYEPNGQQDPIAAGDDNDGYDDEDGVRHIPDSLEPGGTVDVLVTASVDGYLSGWVDFDANGSWLDAGEQVFTNLLIFAGPNTLSFTAPAGAVTPTFTRYRFDTGGGGLAVSGPATDGEVEDHYLRDRGIFSDDWETGNTSAWDITVTSP